VERDSPWADESVTIAGPDPGGDAMDMKARLRVIEDRLGDLGVADDQVFDPRIAPVMWRVLEAELAGLERCLVPGDDPAGGAQLDDAEVRRWRAGFGAAIARAYGRLVPALDGPADELALIVAEIEAECDATLGERG
jgi:hypothetical protein